MLLVSIVVFLVVLVVFPFVLVILPFVLVILPFVLVILPFVLVIASVVLVKTCADCPDDHSSQGACDPDTSRIYYVHRRCCAMR